ncbi:DUF3900 domain-containing protein [Salipaludibacillus sp. CF4.18]|uniref:DUF3900 domain-containing protein n=1 Tax=Salipaludibacillus sp. CF4.18 TaxID=3373081 RepID=UPI003EE59B8F
MRNEWRLKIHQSSHARYSEDFLKYIEYNRSMVEIIRDKVVETAQQYIAETYEEDSEERAQGEDSIEAWSNTLRTPATRKMDNRAGRRGFLPYH